MKQSQVTLDEFAREWWERYAPPSWHARKARVGEPTNRETVALLQAIREAVIGERISSNPVKSVRKRAVVRNRVVRPLTPASVEKVRRQLTKPRDQALVSLLAYAGPRPGDAFGLRWGDIGEGTILVERAISHGAEKSTKTRATRSVQMVKPLKSELAKLRMRNGRLRDDELVFPARDGELMA